MVSRWVIQSEAIIPSVAATRKTSVCFVHPGQSTGRLLRLLISTNLILTPPRSYLVRSLHAALNLCGVPCSGMGKGFRLCDRDGEGVGFEVPWGINTHIHGHCSHGSRCGDTEDRQEKLVRNPTTSLPFPIRRRLHLGRSRDQTWSSGMCGVDSRRTQREK